MLEAVFMTEQELDQLRREKWRLNGAAVRTLDDARRFIESVGFCLMYPMRKPLLAPTFIGAWTGSDKNLPMQQHAYADPRAREATEVMVRLLRNHDAYEANQFEENNAFLVAGVDLSLFLCSGGRTQSQAGPATQAAFGIFPAGLRRLRTDPPRRTDLQAEDARDLGGSISFVALDHALGELWSRLRITRVDYKPEEGAFWDVLYRWAPDAVREGIGLSVGEALSALLSKYLDCVVAADQQEVETFFGNFVPALASEGSDQRVAGRARTGFHPRRKPLACCSSHSRKPLSSPKTERGQAIRPVRPDCPDGVS